MKTCPMNNDNGFPLWTKMTERGFCTISEVALFSLDQLSATN